MPVPGFRGDAIEVEATFELGNATTVGVGLGGAPGSLCVGYTAASKSIGVGHRGPGEWFAGMAPQPAGSGTATIRIFLDRSIVEVYSGGAAMTAVHFGAGSATAKAGLSVWADGGAGKLVSLVAYPMRSMWGPVSAI